MSTTEKFSMGCDSTRAHASLDGLKQAASPEAHLPLIRALGLCIVGDSLKLFALQLRSIANQLEALPSEDTKKAFDVEITLPEPAFPAFGDWYIAASGAVKVAKPGNKIPELLDTYRLFLTIDAAALADIGKFVNETRAIAQSICGEAGRVFDEVQTQCLNVRRISSQSVNVVSDTDETREVARAERDEPLFDSEDRDH